MRLAVTLLLTVTLSACGARAARPGGPENEAAALARDLHALFTAPNVSHAQWGVRVVSLRTGATLYAHNPGQFMIPASNQKLLTTIAAAERLGWDYRFTTRILATGAIDDDGVLQGDLIVTGNGDPTINPRHPARWRAFDDWAVALKAKGLRIVNGQVIGDDDAFAEPGWGVGWAWDNLQYGYGAQATALQYHENQVEVMVGPGMAVGSRAIISTSPLGSGLFIDHGVSTVAAGERTAVDIARIPGTAFLSVRGQVAVDARPLTVLASVDNPTRSYLNALREALARHGIFVSGNMTDIDELRVPPVRDQAVELLRDESAPLAEIADVMLKWSRNEYAETLLMALAPADAPATSAPAIAAMQSVLGELGIAPDRYLPRDGSGLSRYDYVSADVLCDLLRIVAAHPRHAAPFRAALPVAGVSGTLATRMKGTPAEGRVAAKTGSLSNVRTLAGYLTTTSGEPLAFAMMSNNYRVSTAEIDAVTDSALVRLVAWSGQR